MLLHRGDSSPIRTRNSSRFSATTNICAGSTLRRNQAWSEMQSRHLVLGRPLGHFPLGLASGNRLTNLYWDIMFTWPKHFSSETPHASLQRSGLTFWALRIPQLRILWRSVTAWTLRKDPTSAASEIALSVITQDSCPCVRIGPKTDIKLTALRCLKVSVLWPQSHKAHAQLRLLYQTVYQSPCYTVSVTREYHPMSRYLNLSTYCSVLPLNRRAHWLKLPGRHNYISTILVLNFIPTRPYAAQNRAHVGTLFRGFKQHRIACKKQTVDPAPPNSDTLVDSAVTVYPIDYEE